MQLAIRGVETDIESNNRGNEHLPDLYPRNKNEFEEWLDNGVVFGGDVEAGGELFCFVMSSMVVKNREIIIWVEGKGEYGQELFKKQAFAVRELILTHNE